MCFVLCARLDGMLTAPSRGRQVLRPAEVAAGQLGRHYLQRYFLLIAFRCYLGANPVQASACPDTLCPAVKDLSDMRMSCAQTMTDTDDHWNGCLVKSLRDMLQ